MNQSLIKKLVYVILVLYAVSIPFILPAALANSAAYTLTSVTDCVQTSATYNLFYQCMSPGNVVPGLAEGLVPQGVSYLPEDDALLYCGYRADKGNSALILTDRPTGRILKSVSLRYADGRDYNGHAGGVCATESDIYISNAQHLYRISLAAFRQLPENADCRFEEEIPVPVNASFCSYSEGVLWVGEFQYTGDYPTDASHTVRTTDGLQRAWICGYRMDERQAFDAPDCILSVTERIQGMTTIDGTVTLSQSYGRRADSALLQYASALDRAPDGSVPLNGQDIPLWILDSACRTGILLCPPMSEGLCAIGQDLCVLFESAAQPYMDPAKPSVNPLDRLFIGQPK